MLIHKALITSPLLLENHFKNQKRNYVKEGMCVLESNRLKSECELPNTVFTSSEQKILDTYYVLDILPSTLDGLSFFLPILLLLSYN